MRGLRIGGAYTDVALVRRLLMAQFPRWAHLPIQPFRSTGVDNTLYRLGEGMIVRFPRSGWSGERVAKELRWLPWLAPQLPVAVPVPLGVGVPAEGYPWAWSIYTWLDGEPATIERIVDPAGFANDLAAFVVALRQIDPQGGPPASQPLAARDTGVRTLIASLRGAIDVDRATAVWEDACRLPAREGGAVWLHGDLAPGNVLLSEGRLSAVIDFAALGVGDPSDDLRAAWTILPVGTRSIFRDRLQADDATWLRGRGYALAQTLALLLRYRQDDRDDRCDPALAVATHRILNEILAEHPGQRMPRGT